MKTAYIFLMLVFLQACKCGSQKEVSLDVSYSGFEDRPKFDRVVAEGAKRDILLTTKTENMDAYSEFKLPVDSNKDSCRYFFYQAGRVDTVVISYQKILDYGPDDCGFSIDFKEARVKKNTIHGTAYLNLGSRSYLIGTGFEASLEFYY